MATMSMNKAIHGAVRRDLGRFLDALARFQEGDKARAAQLGTAWDNFDSQLTIHHEGEHDIAWPSLAKIGVSQETIAQMDAEHERMADALAKARGAMNTLRTTATDAAAARAAVEHLQTITLEHLDHEENELEDVYLANADGPEMKAMGKQFAKVSPATGGRFFAWVTDGATPEEMAAITRNIPKPVLTIIGGIFGRSYRRDVASVWRS
ncbi:MAG TPA: hemerythrin domain-containing protein [Marmoricola sp.]|nr:hemerythrin domain-containing protein [Marmoricola sp.]